MEKDMCDFIANACRKWRLDKNITLKNMADNCGYSIQNICAFEHGRTNNMLILISYIEHGFNISLAISNYYALSFIKGE